MADNNQSNNSESLDTVKTDKSIECPVCQENNPAQNRFCNTCGAALSSSVSN